MIQFPQGGATAPTARHGAPRNVGTPRSGSTHPTAGPATPKRSVGDADAEALRPGLAPAGNAGHQWWAPAKLVAILLRLLASLRASGAAASTAPSPQNVRQAAGARGNADARPVPAHGALDAKVGDSGGTPLAKLREGRQEAHAARLPPASLRTLAAPAAAGSPQSDHGFGGGTEGKARDAGLTPPASATASRVLPDGASATGMADVAPPTHTAVVAVPGATQGAPEQQSPRAELVPPVDGKGKDQGPEQLPAIPIALLTLTLPALAAVLVSLF